MSPGDMETILKFLMERLPEEELAELDARLEGDAAAAPVSMDAALAKRQAWLGMDSRRRHAVRQARRENRTANAAFDAEFEAMFPNANRLTR